MAKIPIMKIKSKETESGFMLINERDFDPKIHKVFKEKEENPFTPDPKRAKEGTKDE